MKLLIDIGGSGVRVSKYSFGRIHEQQRIASQDELKEMTCELFARLIEKSANGDRIDGIALSVAGFVDSENGVIRRSGCAEKLNGPIVRKLQSFFPRIPIHVINDGEAHARALLDPQHEVLFGDRTVRFGAIHLAFGSAVSFGVINAKKQIVQSCDGGNWDIGDFQLEYDSNRDWDKVYYKLGDKGYQALCDDGISDRDYEFGLRIGYFVRKLAVIFRPRTIGFSGGRFLENPAEIMRGVRETFADPVDSDSVGFTVLAKNSAMEGLMTLF